MAKGISQTTADRITKSRDAAAAFIEDMQYFRELLDKPEPTGPDLRRVSSIIRRLLIESDLKAIAAPRIGRFKIQAPNNYAFHVSGLVEPILFFASLGPELFGVFSRGMLVDIGSVARELPAGFNIFEIIDLSLDDFCKQEVICFEGNWIRRSQVLKYVANVASGVHSGQPKSDIEMLINRIRHAAKISVSNGVPTMEFDYNVFSEAVLPIKYSPKSIDVVLQEVFATVHFLANSPDIVKLEKIIQQELV